MSTRMLIYISKSAHKLSLGKTEFMNTVFPRGVQLLVRRWLHSQEGNRLHQLSRLEGTEGKR